MTIAVEPRLRSDLPIMFLFPQVDFVVAHRRIRGLRSPYGAQFMRFMEELSVDIPGSGGGG